MINAKAVIALPCTRLIIPKCPNLPPRMVQIDRIGPAIVEQAAKGITRIWLHQCVASHRAQIPHVLVLGDHIIIPDHQRGQFFGTKRVHSRAQALHPAQLVVKFGAGLRIAIGQINARYTNATNLCFQISGMLILRFARQPALYLYRLNAICEDGHAIKAFLAMPDCVVADFGKVSGRKAFVLRFNFLQAGDRGARFF